MDITATRAALSADRLTYHPIFTKIGGGLEAGVFLSMLFNWHGKGKDPDGWIYKTQKDIEVETGLTRRNQDTARRKLKELGLLEDDLRGVPATLHYRLNADALELALIEENPSLYESAKLEPKTAESVQTGLYEPGELDCTDAPNLIEQNVQSIPIKHNIDTRSTSREGSPPAPVSAFWLIPENLKVDEFIKLWGLWLEHVDAARLTFTEPQAAVKLAELSDVGPAMAINSVKVSLFKGWKNIYITDEAVNARTNGHSTKSSRLVPAPASERTPGAY